MPRETISRTGKCSIGFRRCRRIIRALSLNRKSQRREDKEWRGQSANWLHSLIERDEYLAIKIQRTLFDVRSDKSNSIDLVYTRLIKQSIRLEIQGTFYGNTILIDELVPMLVTADSSHSGERNVATNSLHTFRTGRVKMKI